jgi:hypothetical protein
MLLMHSNSREETSEEAFTPATSLRCVGLKDTTHR